MISPTRIAEITALAGWLGVWRRSEFGQSRPGRLFGEASTAMTELLAEREAMVARMASATEAFESIKEFADSGENFLCWKVADDAIAALKEQL